MAKNRRLRLCALICGSCCTIMTTGAVAGDFKPLLRISNQFFTFAMGDSIDVRAGGQLFTGSGGVLYKPARQNYTLEATVGYKFNQDNSQNGSSEFDFIASLAHGKHRLGAGITYHPNPELICKTTSACSATTTFPSAVGFIGQHAYSFPLEGEKAIDIGIRFTMIDYESDGGDKIESNALSAFIGFIF